MAVKPLKIENMYPKRWENAEEEILKADTTFENDTEALEDKDADDADRLGSDANAFAVD